MLICYCEKCGLRVDEKELQSGKALRLSETTVACAQCAPEFRPKPPVAPRQPSGRIERSAATMQSGATAAASPPSRQKIVIASVVTVLLFGGVCAVIFSRAPNPAPAKVETAKLSPPATPNVPAVGAESAKKEPPQTPPPVAQPREIGIDEERRPRTQSERERAVDAELADIRKTSASRRLAEMKKSYSENPTQIYEYQEKLNDFVKRYPGLPAAEEATALLAKLKLPAANASVSFVKVDTATRGNWKKVYGREGYVIAEGPKQAGSTVNIKIKNGATHVWKCEEKDEEVLQTDAGRLSSCWHTNTNFTIDIDVIDDKLHQVALYLLDYHNNNSREQKVECLQLGSGKVLDTREMKSFSDGQWLVWNVSGRVRIRITFKTGTNAVVSGVFIDPVAP